jgi:hypothetical protein
MSEVVHNAQHEYWRPPAAQQSAATPVMVEACDRCGMEFMVGARFCHLCGASAKRKLTQLMSVAGHAICSSRT